MEFYDLSTTTDKCISSLLSHMTIEEKVAQLSCIMPSMLIGEQFPDPSLMQRYLVHGLGRMTQFSATFWDRPHDIAKTANTIQAWVEHNTRLAIPVLFQNEALNGLMAIDATSFPSPINMAATWKPDLIEEAAAIIRCEMRALGLHKALSPVLDLAQDPRWGRMNETYGEDPYLCSQIGNAYIHGLQTDDIRQGVAACAKHFLGYSRTQGGLNIAEINLTDRDLYEYFAFPFESAIHTCDLKSIMVTYSALGGIPISIHQGILRDLLREKMNFKGNLLCDGGSIEMCVTHQHVCENMQEAGLKAILAGLDADTPVTEAYLYLPDLVRQGKLKMEVVDEAVSRVLRLKFEMGLFENRYVDEKNIDMVFIEKKENHMDTAKRIAQESVILLKNKDNLLPIPAETEKIAVIGPHADNMRAFFGAYTMPASIEMYQQIFKSSKLGQDPKATMGGIVQAEQKQLNEVPQEDRSYGFDRFYDSLLKGGRNYDIETIIRRHYTSKTLRQAIQDSASISSQVRYAKGCSIQGNDKSKFTDALTLAKWGDIVIAAMGDQSGWISGTAGEGHDRSSLQMPGVQEKLLQAIKATGKPIVLVLFNARPHAIRWAEENVDAILDVWFPGQMGAEAIAEILYGEVNPSGKLPVTIPRSVGQVPIYYNHRLGSGYWSPLEETIQLRSEPYGGYVNEPATPLYPFGFGLSYTKFAFSDLRIDDEQPDINGNVEISCTLQNTGKRYGAEVVQLYIFDREAPVTRPVKKLVGFKKVELEPGQARQVRFTLPISQLAFLDENMELIVEPGNIDVFIGSSSSDIHLNGSFNIHGEQKKIIARRTYQSQVEVV